uniref:Bri3 binding protein n=1 Tax=Cyprinus carpio TaxID=7962 RepID=A0A8C1GKZ4_CYPCA
ALSDRCSTVFSPLHIADCQVVYKDEGNEACCGYKRVFGFRPPDGCRAKQERLQQPEQLQESGQRFLPNPQQCLRRGEHQGAVQASNLTHYFSPSSVSSSPARALLLVAALLVAYWFLSLFLSGFFYILHAMFGRFFWLARVALFALSCLYILQKFEGDPEKAVLPLCFIMAVYFMTGPVGAYWRKGGGPGTLEEKIDHLDTQIRLLNIRLSRVIENLERSSDQ